MSLNTYVCIVCGSSCNSRVGQTKGPDGKVIKGLGTWRCPKGCKNKRGKTPVRRTPRVVAVAA